MDKLVSRLKSSARAPKSPRSKTGARTPDAKATLGSKASAADTMEAGRSGEAGRPTWAASDKKPPLKFWLSRPEAPAVERSARARIARAVSRLPLEEQGPLAESVEMMLRPVLGEEAFERLSEGHLTSIIAWLRELPHQEWPQVLAMAIDLGKTARHLLVDASGCDVIDGVVVILEAMRPISPARREATLRDAVGLAEAATSYPKGKTLAAALSIVASLPDENLGPLKEPISPICPMANKKHGGDFLRLAELFSKMDGAARSNLTGQLRRLDYTPEASYHIGRKARCFSAGI